MTDSCGKPISAVRLINKMILLNEAAEIVKSLEEQQVEGTGKDSTARVGYDLQQRMEDDESARTHLLGKQPHFYKTLFPECAVQINEVIPK